MPSAYSEDLKWRIVFLRHSGYSKRQIAEILYVSRSLIYKVLWLYKKWGTVVNPWRQIPGRQNTDLYLDEIVWKMEIRSNKHVSISTLWRSLAYCGIT
ncbi:15803_t:CDS:2, partial [Dentiscutata erythropus]